MLADKFQAGEAGGGVRRGQDAGAEAGTWDVQWPHSQAFWMKD